MFQQCAISNILFRVIPLIWSRYIHTKVLPFTFNAWLPGVSVSRTAKRIDSRFRSFPGELTLLLISSNLGIGGSHYWSPITSLQIPHTEPVLPIVDRLTMLWWMSGLSLWHIHFFPPCSSCKRLIEESRPSALPTVVRYRVHTGYTLYSMILLII